MSRTASRLIHRLMNVDDNVVWEQSVNVSHDVGCFYFLLLGQTDSFSQWALWTIPSAIAALTTRALHTMYRTGLGRVCVLCACLLCIIRAGPDYSEMPSAGWYLVGIRIIHLFLAVTCKNRSQYTKFYLFFIQYIFWELKTANNYDSTVIFPSLCILTLLDWNVLKYYCAPGSLNPWKPLCV